MCHGTEIYFLIQFVGSVLQKIKRSCFPFIKDFFSKVKHIGSFLLIWWHLLKTPSKETQKPSKIPPLDFDFLVDFLRHWKNISDRRRIFGGNPTIRIAMLPLIENFIFCVVLFNTLQKMTIFRYLIGGKKPGEKWLILDVSD